MALVCIYRGTGPTDATLVQHWLQRNGIDAHVQGDLLGLRGEIPVSEAWPTVWVPEGQRAEAEQAIAVFEGPTLVHPKWTCPRCGEENEPTFASCWHCERERVP